MNTEPKTNQNKPEQTRTMSTYQPPKEIYILNKFMPFIENSHKPGWLIRLGLLEYADTWTLLAKSIDEVKKGQICQIARKFHNLMLEYKNTLAKALNPMNYTLGDIILKRFENEIPSINRESWLDETERRVKDLILRSGWLPLNNFLPGNGWDTDYLCYHLDDHSEPVVPGSSRVASWRRPSGNSKWWMFGGEAGNCRSRPNPSKLGEFFMVTDKKQKKSWLIQLKTGYVCWCGVEKTRGYLENVLEIPYAKIAQEYKQFEMLKGKNGPGVPKNLQGESPVIKGEEFTSWTEAIV